MSRRIPVALSLLVVAVIAACDTSASLAPDAASIDAATGCPASGVTEDEATRTAEAASVTVSARLDNALTHCAKPDLAFALVFDTHSVDLLAIDIPASSRLETSAGGGAGVSRWSPGSESSHHRDGTLTILTPTLTEVDWIRLTIVDVASVDRVFEWNATLLAHDLP